jgi:DNA phosphorothioation-dependent restriction protein DptH
MRPGRLVIIDMRDELVDKSQALALFMVILNRFSEAKTAEGSFNKLIVFDEAHKYMDEETLTSSITDTVREMRHRGTSVVIASQNPPSVPQDIIELSTVIIAHKFTSPAWLRHLQKMSQAFSHIRGSQLTDLTPGKAYVWAVGNPRFERPQRVDIRARLTKHGGETRRATQ